MSSKGISEIIATILMLMITIGLAGTAFIYIQGVLVGRTQKQISFADASCSAPTTMYITVKNLDTTLNISYNELLVRVDNTPAIGIQLGNWTPSSIPPQQNSVLSLSCNLVSGLSCALGTIHSVKALGPSNAVDGQAIC